MNQRQFTGGGLAVYGGLLAAIQFVHAVQQTSIPVAIAVDGIPFVAMGAGMMYVGYWIARAPSFEPTADRIAVWTAGGTIVFAAVTALVLFSQRVTTGSLVRASYLTVDLVTVGALAGVMVGIYDARSRERLHDLERERDRVESFAEKATDANNYGRIIGSAQSLEGVAAYVVEAFSSLAGIGESAVVTIDDDSVFLVANTIRTVDDEAVGALAADAVEQAVGDVEFERKPTSTSFPSSASGVMTALIGDGDGASTVVVALPTGDVRAEEQRLVELVVRHASARLNRLQRTGADRR